jgi:hypothetical protein
LGIKRQTTFLHNRQLHTFIIIANPAIKTPKNTSYHNFSSIKKEPIKEAKKAQENRQD